MSRWYAWRAPRARTSSATSRCSTACRVAIAFARTHVRYARLRPTSAVQASAAYGATTRTKNREAPSKSWTCVCLAAAAIRISRDHRIQSGPLRSLRRLYNPPANVLARPVPTSLVPMLVAGCNDASTSTEMRAKRTIEAAHNRADRGRRNRGPPNQRERTADVAHSSHRECATCATRRWDRRRPPSG